jgi:hypothetical protein
LRQSDSVLHLIWGVSALSRSGEDRLGCTEETLLPLKFGGFRLTYLAWGDSCLYRIRPRQNSDFRWLADKYLIPCGLRWAHPLDRNLIGGLQGQAG